MLDGRVTTASDNDVALNDSEQPKRLTPSEPPEREAQPTGS